jgi:hypothetical protein
MWWNEDATPRSRDAEPGAAGLTVNEAPHSPGSGPQRGQQLPDQPGRLIVLRMVASGPSVEWRQ